MSHTPKIPGLQTDAVAIETNVSTLQTDVSSLQTNVSTLQTDVSTLQTDSGGTNSESYTNTYSASFDGANDYMDCSATFTSLWAGSFSISLWLKTPSTFTAGVDNYLGNDFVQGQGYIEFRQRQVTSSTAKIEFYLSNSATGSSPYGTYGAETSAILSTNSWYHLVLTVDRPSSGTTTATLYVDGSVTILNSITGFLSSIPNAGGTWSNNTLICARNNSSSGSGSGELFLEGHLDELAFFNSVLSSSHVTTTYNSGAPADISSLNPVGWWRMGDNDGGTGTTITDQGSGGNNGTLTNGPTFSTDVPELFANTYSLSFDGSDDYVDISGIASSINSWTNVSWSTWYKGTDATGYIFRASPAGAANPHIGMSISSGKLFGVVFDGSNQSSNTHQTTINDNNWHHLAVTFNGVTGVLTTYVDSVACTTTVYNGGGGIGTGYTAANIGRRPSSSHLYTGGLIDEFAIWNSVLSSSDITNVYNNGVSNDISSLNPVGWWRMGDNDSGTGTTITDQGSGGNNGTLTNGPTFSTTIPS